ncbi:MAG: hypothetical protein QNJ54_15445 [Prochloraceae cyanobacterium]|nr:hypothetical protein [Prochloraceae cyanobacterium]
MTQALDFKETIENQKQLIVKLQELLKREIEAKAKSEKLEELSSAIESATEALNNLKEYFEDR